MATDDRLLLTHPKLLAELVLPITSICALTISSSTIKRLLYTEAKTLKTLPFKMTTYEREIHKYLCVSWWRNTPLAQQRIRQSQAVAVVCN
jgi:hypothetical protein